MIIGLTGLMGSGKDTAGEYLVKQYGFKQIRFTTALKKSAAANWPGLPPEAWDVWKNDPGIKVQIVDQQLDPLYSVTAREFLQHYGTEAHRHIFGDNIWVDIAFQGIKANEDIVITDCRFDNEARIIKAQYQNPGVVIRIDRGLPANQIHLSEAGVSDDLVDTTIDNTGSLVDLYLQLDGFIKGVKIGQS